MIAEHFKSIADIANREKNEEIRERAKAEYAAIQSKIEEAANNGLYFITTTADPDLASFIEMLLRADGFKYSGYIISGCGKMFQYTVKIGWNGSEVVI